MGPSHRLALVRRGPGGGGLDFFAALLARPMRSACALTPARAADHVPAPLRLRRNHVARLTPAACHGSGSGETGEVGETETCGCETETCASNDVTPGRSTIDKGALNTATQRAAESLRFGQGLSSVISKGCLYMQ